MARDTKNKRDIRIGETRMMKCGVEASIIAYKNSRHIDVRFTDGVVVKDKRYSSFRAGTIEHPILSIEQRSKGRMGETRMMKCGVEATVIEYRSSDNIDIKFSDGTIMKNQIYRRFFLGDICHPDLSKQSKLIDRCGEVKMMNCGMKAEIIAYRRSSSIDVKFSDGAIVELTTYQSFKTGKISHPNFSKKKAATNRVGETQVMKCGISAKIIAYRSSTDIDIQFDDGTILKNYNYVRFKNGKMPNIKRKQLNASLRIGEKNKMNCGIIATIIEYKGSSDITVKFEDGVIVKGRSYSAFKNGSIQHPHLHNCPISKAHERIGETRTMNCGVDATIIRYKNALDMDIQFPDGTIRKKCTYNHFKNGSIFHSTVS